MEEPIAELTIRLYPQSNERGREQIRQICLTFGCIRPNEKQDSIIDVLNELELAQRQGKWIKREEIEQQVTTVRKELSKEIPGSSTIRRHLKWLLDSKVIEREKAKYRIISFKPLLEAFIESHEARFSELINHAKLSRH